MLAPAPKYHDVTIKLVRKTQRACVEAVPPEEFGIARNAKTIKDAGYCFHEVMKSEADLIADGYDEDQVRKLPSYGSTKTIESNARDTVDETTAGEGDEGINRANRQIQVTEHYVLMDYEGEGEACLHRVATAGEGDVLRRDDKDDVERVDCAPFASLTPVPVTHRFFGRSVADLVMDIQRIKTALTRGMLDNIYMSNLPRPVISETGSTESTLDDLLVAQHGKPIRVKGPVNDALAWQQVPDISGHVYPALQYMDATREWRTGVSRQGQGVDPNALQNQVATIANQMYNAAQAKTKLIARIFAETGIRDLFQLLHAIIRKHGSQQQTVRLRNKWVTVDPREWQAREDMTVSVGLGTGSKSEQIAHLTTIMGIQKELLMAGKTNLVEDQHVYNSAKEMTKLVGQKDTDRFFSDPAGKPPPPAPMDPKIQVEQMKAENAKQVAQMKLQHDQQVASFKLQGEQHMASLKAQLEQQKVQSDVTRQAAQAESDARLEAAKFEFDKQLALLEARLAAVEAEREHQYRLAELGMKQRAAEHSADIKERESDHKVQTAQQMADIKVESTQKITDAKTKNQPKKGK